jgi:hypothetical protein
MRTGVRGLLVVAAAAVRLNGGVTVHTQAIDPALLTSGWQARWIAPAGAPPRAFGVHHFRHTFDLTDVLRAAGGTVALAGGRLQRLGVISCGMMRRREHWADVPLRVRLVGRSEQFPRR